MPSATVEDHHTEGCLVHGGIVSADVARDHSPHIPVNDSMVAASIDWNSSLRGSELDLVLSADLNVWRAQGV